MVVWPILQPKKHACGSSIGSTIRVFGGLWHSQDKNYGQPVLRAGSAATRISEGAAHLQLCNEVPCQSESSAFRSPSLSFSKFNSPSRTRLGRSCHVGQIIYSTVPLLSFFLELRSRCTGGPLTKVWRILLGCITSWLLLLCCSIYMAAQGDLRWQWLLTPTCGYWCPWQVIRWLSLAFWLPKDVGLVVNEKRPKLRA